ncbi:MAG: HU family DNA-binding protein [Thermodesulfovibrionales bacterium]
MRRNEHHFFIALDQRILSRLNNRLKRSLYISSLTQSVIIHYLFISRGGNMTKQELIEKMAKDADISTSEADAALKSFMDGIKKTLKKGDKVTMVGFGTFSIGKRAARTGRNPQTGAAIKIKASKSPKFKAGKGFKDAVK